MEDSTFVVIEWPAIQELMGEKGFRQNSILINSDPLLEEFGSSAYLVRLGWLSKLIKKEALSKIRNNRS